MAMFRVSGLGLAFRLGLGSQAVIGMSSALLVL